MPEPERTLILGWYRQAPGVINGLDTYVAPGSQPLVVARGVEAEQQVARACLQVQNLSVSFKQENTTRRPALDALAIPTFHHVVVMSYSGTLDEQAADAQTTAYIGIAAGVLGILLRGLALIRPTS